MAAAQGIQIRFAFLYIGKYSTLSSCLLVCFIDIFYEGPRFSPPSLLIQLVSIFGIHKKKKLTANKLQSSAESAILFF